MRVCSFIHCSQIGFLKAEQLFEQLFSAGHCIDFAGLAGFFGYVELRQLVGGLCHGCGLAGFSGIGGIFGRFGFGLLFELGGGYPRFIAGNQLGIRGLGGIQHQLVVLQGIGGVGRVERLAVSIMAALRLPLGIQSQYLFGDGIIIDHGFCQLELPLAFDPGRLIDLFFLVQQFLFMQPSPVGFVVLLAGLVDSAV